MSEQLPIKIAHSPAPSSNKASTAAPNNGASGEEQREFGNVLSNQVQQQGSEKAPPATNSASPAAGASNVADEDTLPQDGKTLPVGPELLELASSANAVEGGTALATTGLVPAEDETGLDAGLVATDDAGLDAGLVATDDAGLDAGLVATDAAGLDAGLVATDDAGLLAEGDDVAALAAPFISVDSQPNRAATQSPNGKKPANPAASVVLPGVAARPTPTTTTATDNTAQARAVTQLRQAESLEGNVISLATRGEVEKTAFQTNKIIERFTEVRAQQATTSTNNISTPVASVGPVNTSSSAASSATGLQQVSIDVPVQHQQWQRAFAERVVWSVGNNQSVQVRVNPAELGPIDIQVNVTKEQTNITFNTAHAMTRETIESAIPRLRDMLASEGLNLGDVDVRHQDSSAQGQTASQDQGSGAGRNAGFGDGEQLLEGPAEVMLHPVMVSDRAVDYYI